MKLFINATRQLMLTILIALITVNAHADRLKDLATLAGVRSNVGSPGTELEFAL